MTSYLVDTDILVDWLRGMPWTKGLFWSEEIVIYYSAVTRRELLRKKGITASEREKILTLLSLHRPIPVDPHIAAAASELLAKYSDRNLRIPDALIAATSWVKGIPLLTRNFRHYQFIEEIQIIVPR